MEERINLLDWYNRVYPKLKGKERPMECVQEAGDIVYLVGTFHIRFVLVVVRTLMAMEHDLPGGCMSTKVYLCDCKNADDKGTLSIRWIKPTFAIARTLVIMYVAV